MSAHNHTTLLAQAATEYHRYYPEWLANDSLERVVGCIAVSMGIHGYADVPFEERKRVAREVIEKESE